MSLGKILVIDDDPDQCLLYKMIFEALDYQVVSAEDGLKGVMLANTLKPDIALVDFNMPELDGVEVLEGINDSIEESIPVVIVSGTDDPAQIERIQQSSYVYYIPKGSLDNEELANKIIDIIDTHKSHEKDNSGSNEAVLAHHI